MKIKTMIDKKKFECACSFCGKKLKDVKEFTEHNCRPENDEKDEDV